ncbi:unnamed protein product [Effrenium voratum]|uniref:Uncharacterized protein n=1 Tax=Effrenium voratum TaxID=2562239 RepID=A0AA36J3G0_9DINO|nr:unnamed protein product [Effrenium voratum]
MAACLLRVAQKALRGLRAQQTPPWPGIRLRFANRHLWHGILIQTTNAVAKGRGSAAKNSLERGLRTLESGTKQEEPEKSSKVSLCLCGRVKPTFGWAEDVKPSCCSQCKAEGMVKLRGPKCRYGRAWPVFGMPGDERPTCCSKCKADGMVDIKNRKCQCGKARPYFGFPNDARATCCSKCKHHGMMDIKNLRCRCSKARPSFGFADDVRPTCCKQCKAAEMVDIRSPRCKMCKKQARYPDEAGRPKQLCAVHSAEVGAHVLSSPRRSRTASECFDALEAEWGHKPFRYRFDIKTGTWSGEEVAGLVPSRNLQPDAYDPEARKIFEFLGNYFHGFPPHHPQQFS